MTNLNDEDNLKMCLASCHSLTTINNVLTGDPLDAKMFEGTGKLKLMDIKYGRMKNCRQFRLPTWTSFIAQFVICRRGRGKGGVVDYYSQLQVSLQ